MGRNAKKFSYWVQRRSGLPILIVGAIVVVMLLFNDETSISLNIKYQKEITELKKKIKENNDSAQYYKVKKESILNGGADLERIAREQYHMQKPTEDIYIIKSE